MIAPARARAALLLSAVLLAAFVAVACGSGAATPRAATGSRSAQPGTATSKSGTAQSGTAQSGTAQAPAAAVPAGDWSQFNYNAQRSGVGSPHTGITAANLHLLRRRVIHLDGTVDSAPIELHAVRVAGRVRDVVVVTTTYGRTIALDAATGAKLWEFVPATIASYEGSSQVTTASPTADPNRRYVYATSPDGLVHKLALASGRQVRSGGWPVRVTLDPTREKLASPPSLLGGSLIVVTDGYYGDAPNYQGHVVKIDRSTGRIQALWNALCSNRRYLQVPNTCPESDSAIWGRAGAVIEPGGSGRILVATGNGAFNGNTDWGDSVLELSSNLQLLHNWTPTNQHTLDVNDGDVGSSSPVLLPATGNTRFVVQAGKSGTLWLLNLNALDGTSGPAGPRLGGELQQIAAPGGSEVFTAPAVWQHGGQTYVFVADASGTAAYVLGADRRLHVAWQDGTPGTSPVIAGGLLYAYDEVNGGLVVRRPTSGQLLATLPAGPGHWNSPIVVGGRIVLPQGGSTQEGTTTGVVNIYSLPGR